MNFEQIEKDNAEKKKPSIQFYKNSGQKERIRMRDERRKQFRERKERRERKGEKRDVENEFSRNLRRRIESHYSRERKK